MVKDGDETEYLQAFVKACHDLISLHPDRNAAAATHVELGATDTELASLVDQYRAGLEAELMLLHRLYAVAIEQRSATQIGAELQCIIERRDRIMTTLVTVEHELKAVRQHLAADRDRLIELPAFQELVDRQTEASDLVAETLAVDRDSLDTLADAEQDWTSSR